ncbi:MAG: SGNH/GDSL hydrolase family protein [Nitrospiraceae bacterium]|nr:SGNH/GDSL hydrolase family protein [Nitrospiraceae bacterium]
MAAKLSFAEFDARLKSGALKAADYRKVLERDPTCPMVRVRFKPGALRDAPPAGYDVDRELYFAKRTEQERQLAALVPTGLKRILAEGDSWFNLPPIMWPEAIADRLHSNNRVVVKNIAHWGDTLSQMLATKEYLEQIPRFNPDWFIFSGGGNDLQQSLARGELVQTYDSNRPIEKCLSEQGVGLLRDIAEGYRALLNQIAMAAPSLHTICYAYDFPRPTYKDGKYIGQYLQKMGYPKTTWNAVVKVIIDHLSDSIKAVAKAFPNVRFLDCRGETTKYPFFDDMHPDTDGFKILASKYEQAFGVVPIRSSKPGTRTLTADRKQKPKGSRGSSKRGPARKVSKKNRTNPQRG